MAQNGATKGVNHAIGVHKSKQQNKKSAPCSANTDVPTKHEVAPTLQMEVGAQHARKVSRNVSLYTKWKNGHTSTALSDSAIHAEALNNTCCQCLRSCLPLKIGTLCPCSDAK